MNRYRWLWMATLLLSVGCAAAGAQSTGEPARLAAAYGDWVRLVDEPFAVHDFSMPSSTGHELRLSDLRGRWVLIFFGYTHCPDFCPLTLSDFVKVKEELGPLADKVAFVYISVDGLRDTPDLMRRYLAYFDPTFIGLSGDDTTLERIHTDYDLYYRRSVIEGSDTYIVDHSTRTYLVDPQGLLQLSFAYSTEPEVMAEVLRGYMAAAAGSAR